MSKLISVIMPVKNGEKYIKEAIQGIQNQKMDVEIIVVNDASTDNTGKIAEQMGCTVLNHEKTMGPVVAKNTGLKQAHGEYIMFHDGDDIMNEGALCALYDILEADASLMAVMGKVKDFVSSDCQTNNSGNVAKPEPYYGLFTGAVLIRRSVFDIINSFSEKICSGEIMEWEGKMKEYHLPIRRVDIITTNRRIHDHNFGKTHRMTEFRDYAQILRQRLKKS